MQKIHFPVFVHKYTAARAHNSNLAAPSAAVQCNFLACNIVFSPSSPAKKGMPEKNAHNKMIEDGFAGPSSIPLSPL
jgi:hypothetical protein